MSLLTLFAAAAAAGGGGFSPLDLSPLAWWDYTDRDSMNGGVVPAVSDPLDSTADKSGNDYHMAASGTARPQLAQDANGVYCARYDGIDDVTTAPALSNILSGSTQATIVIVAKVNSTALVNALYSYGADNAQGSCYLYSFQGNAAYAGLYGGNKLEGGATGPGLNLTILAQRFDLTFDLTSAQAIRQRFNGADKTLSFIGSAPSASIVVPLGANQFKIGSLNGYVLDADVYEAVVFDGLLSDADLDSLVDYFTIQCQV